tara:strand:- start:202 stop:510 length:309 start_codon:yes stop_codon:yes gene_type:complete
MDYVTQVGIGGIFAILVIKQVLDFLSKRRNENPNGDCRVCLTLLQKIYEMHDKTDEDGVYVWYVRRSLEDAITKLGRNIEKQTHIFEKLVMRLESEITTIKK